jgi:hypothetical protein
VLVNEPLMLPEPLDAIPVTEPVLFLAQLYVVPPEPPLSAIELTAEPEHIVCEEGDAVTTLEDVLTCTVDVMAVPVQPFAVGVMVNVTVTAEPVVLVKVPVILPVPFDAMPVAEDVLFLVQL